LSYSLLYALSAENPRFKESPHVVIGAGFAGLPLVRSLVKRNYQVVLIGRLHIGGFMAIIGTGMTE
jgi:monoamine oxidase